MLKSAFWGLDIYYNKCKVYFQDYESGLQSRTKGILFIGPRATRKGRSGRQTMLQNWRPRYKFIESAHGENDDPAQLHRLFV